MSIASYYDVLLVGTHLGNLVAGALLSRRGFRVLLVAQEELPPTYEIAGLSLPRAPFAVLAAHSPVARRALAELALHQSFRRHAIAMDPALQIALPKHRLDVPLDESELDREIEREFPEVRRLVEDFHRTVQRASSDLDTLLERDVVWPPETFLQRREFARATSGLSLTRLGEARDPFSEFPEEHRFPTAVSSVARFADGIDPDHTTSLRTARAWSSWLRGAATFEGGYTWLRQALVDRVQTHGGEVRERERVGAIVVRRGAAVGVQLAGSGDEIGCAFVIAGCDVAPLLRLLPDRHPFEELFERIGEPQPRWYRYTLNLVVAAQGVPVGMARDVFFARDPKRPPIAENLLHVEAHAPDAQGRRLLCVECLLPRRGIEDVPGYVEGVRERVFASLGELVPFLGRHVQLVDSPHDGRPVQDVLGGRSVPAPEPWTRGPQTMPAIYGYPVTTALGLAAMPVRTPIRGLLLCNSQVIPGLGQEGLLLAAWNAARIVTKADRKKAQMRRGLWTKVEI